MSRELLKKFYEDKYEHEKTGSSLITLTYKKHPINRYDASYKYFIDNFKTGSILELGVGDGIVAKSLLGSKLDIKKYVATDFSENRLIGLKNSINDARLELAYCDLDDIDIQKFGKFDAIIMTAVIEHVIDPIKVMNDVNKLLVPGGFVYLETPNAADYGARYKMLKGQFPATASHDEGLTTYKGMPVDLFDEGHLHYFTYKSLSKMLINFCGFSKTEKYYCPTGKLFLGKPFHYFLAKLWPEMFSMLNLIAKK